MAQAEARQDQGSLTAEERVTGAGGGKEGSDQHPTDTLVPVTTDIFTCHFYMSVSVCVWGKISSCCKVCSKVLFACICVHILFSNVHALIFLTFFILVCVHDCSFISITYKQRCYRRVGL